MQPKSIQRKESMVPQGTSISICSSMLFMIGQSWYEMKRRPYGYCVSFFSVLIVVAASAVNQSIIDRAPFVFFKLAEGLAAQSDILLNVNPNYLSEEQDKSPQYLIIIYSGTARQQGYLIVDFMNFTRVNEILGPERANQTSPRIQYQMNFTYLQKTGDCENHNNSQLKQKQKNVRNLRISKRQEFGSQAHFNDLRDGQYLGHNCGGQQPHLDILKEKAIRLGWEYPFGEFKKQKQQ
ncbi:unnamed protein product [Paramecium sonneborni]|uniref:Uncharacterized protein n=1 Tax=Paramecium sonneborni TaxID=65129 RepID=A0A8S1RMB6_9CILI|nr:unnamed protein product [Paramecium sonneborni]